MRKFALALGGVALLSVAILAVFRPEATASSGSTATTAEQSASPRFELVLDNGSGVATLIVHGRTIGQGLPAKEFCDWLCNVWQPANKDQLFVCAEVGCACCLKTKKDKPLKMSFRYVPASHYPVHEYLPVMEIPKFLADNKSVHQYRLIYEKIQPLQGPPEGA